MRETVVPITEKSGSVPVVNGEGQVIEVVTAGDLTQLMEHDKVCAKRPVRDVMTRNPRTARVGWLGSASVHRMEQEPGHVMAFPVVDETGMIVGMVHLQDLLRSGAL